MRGASGPIGQLRHGYQVAVKLGAWDLVLEPRIPRVYTFKAKVLSRHDFWSTQSPLDLVLHVGNATWIWCDVRPVYDGEAVTIQILVSPSVSERAPAKEQGVRL